MNNTEKGKAFENYVASIYQSLGYKVEVSQELFAKQTDIFAEKHTGEAGVIKLAIECKYLSEGAVKNQDVHDFLTVISNMIRNGKTTKGIMVTNSHFSDKAKKVAEEDGSIQLLTIKQLEGSVFELTSPYLIFKNAYEKKHIFNTYVPLKATVDYSGLSEKTDIENVETYIIEYTSKIRNNFLTIFGDYGAGKTTLLERIKYNFVQRYLSGESTIKPIIILLKDFQEHQTIDKLLHHTIIKEFNHEIPIDLFRSAVNEGNILLLLDGFDEMIQQIDDRKRKENFFLLCKLLPANAILTCRPSYFGTYSEYNTYLSEVRNRGALAMKELSNQKTQKINRTKIVTEQLMNHFLQQRIGYDAVKNIEFVTLRLATFDEPQIDIYLQKFNKSFLAKYGKDWVFVKKILQKQYGIKEILQRPILLEIIVETVLFDNFDITKDLENTGPAHLYDIYTTYHLYREWDKGKSRQLIRNKDRKIFAIAIGVSMFLDNKSSVTYDDIKAIIKEQYANTEIATSLKEINIEYLASDIQTCTFLTISLSDSFAFVHKSFMEFFVSSFITELILKYRHSKILDYVLTKEIIYFLHSFCLVYENLKTSVLHWHRRLSHDASATMNHRRNICCVLLSVFKKPQNLSFDDYSISFITLDRIYFENCSFIKTTFSEVVASELVFSETQNASISIINSEFRSSAINCEKLTLHLQDSVLTDMSFTTDRMHLLSLRGGLIKEGNFNFKSAVFTGDLRLENCAFNNCHFDLSAGEYNGAAVNIMSSKFNHCTLSMEMANTNHYVLTNSIFDKCTFSGLVFPENDYVDKKFTDCRGYIFIYEFHKDSKNKILNDMLEFQNHYSGYNNAKEEEQPKKTPQNKITKKGKEPEDHLHFEKYYVVDKKLLIIYEPAWRHFKKQLLLHMDKKDGRPDWIGDFVKRHQSPQNTK